MTLTTSSTTPDSRDERVQRVSWFNRLFSRPEFGAIVGALLVFIMFTLFSWDADGGVPGFIKGRAVMTWLKFSAEIGIIGIGATLLMIGGEFDLSVGSMIGAAGLIVLSPIVMAGWAPWQAILVAFLAAALIGWINGTLVNGTGLPSFIVTLAFLYILRGATLVVTRMLTGGSTRVDIQALVGQHGIENVPEARAYIRSDWLSQMFSGDVWGTPKLFEGLANIGLIDTVTKRVLVDGERVPMEVPIIEGIPVAIGWWVALTLIAIFVLQRTQFGNWIFGTGGHPESARNIGVPTNLVKTILFMITAMCATVFACLQVFEAGSTDVLRGQLKEFEAIIVAVIGGTLLTGGYGSIMGAFYGALIYGMISRGIEIVRWMPSDWFRIFLGVGLLAAVILNTYIRRRATEAR